VKAVCQVSEPRCREAYGWAGWASCHWWSELPCCTSVKRRKEKRRRERVNERMPATTTSPGVKCGGGGWASAGRLWNDGTPTAGECSAEWELSAGFTCERQAFDSGPSSVIYADLERSRRVTNIKGSKKFETAPFRANPVPPHLFHRRHPSPTTELTPHQIQERPCQPQILVDPGFHWLFQRRPG
jgi:hypothetical protein